MFKRLAKLRPALSLEISQSGILDTDVEFIKKTVMSSLFMSFGLCFIAGVIFSKLGKPVVVCVILFPFLWLMFFMYFLQYPYIKTLKVEREIDREIIYAGRFLVIELESGITIYDAFRQVSKNYEIIGKYFQNIVDDVNLGTPVDAALNKAIEETPSRNLRRLLWQIVNSMSTGANSSTSVASVVEQITREQKVKLVEYSRKLNPLAMFYMIIAVIFPSIGVTMFVILVSFLSIELSLTVLLLIAAFMGFVQFMFYTIIRSSRPAFQIE